MMKNYFLFLFAMLFTLTMAAQKSPTDTNPIDMILLKDQVSNTYEIPTRTMGASSRSREDELIFDKKEFISEGDIIEFTHSKSRIGSGRYRVVLTSLTGNADLILAGEHSDYLSWREISYSSKSGSYDDILEYKAWDLRHDEDALKIVVIGQKSSTYRIKIYRVNENLSACNRTAIEEIKEWLCYLCEVNTLYHAEYFGRPVLYVEQTCTQLQDAGGKSIYDCDGNQIAYAGFAGLTIQFDFLKIKNKIYECSNQSKTCDDFTDYTIGEGISEQSSDWVKWDRNSSDVPVKPIIYSEFINGTHFTFMDHMLEIVDDGRSRRQDVVYLTGDTQSGKKVISWDMVVHPDQTGYFNLQRYSNPLGNPLMHIFFKNGTAKIYNSDRSRLLGTFNYPEGNFFKVELGVDLDRNKIIIYTDNGDLTLSYCCDIQLGGINFYAIDDASFLIDDLCMEEVTSLPLVSRTNATSRSKALDLELPTINTNPLKKVRTSVNAFKVFPNPSKGMTTIQFEQDNGEDLSIEVFNQTGQLVKQLPVGTESYVNQAIDLSDLPNGMYIVKLRGATINLNQKLLLQQ